MEAKSRALDRRAAEEAAMDTAELVGENDEDEPPLEFFELPEKGAEDTVDSREVYQRIQDCVKVLDDFKNLGAKGRSRSEYVEQLLKDIANYYGYNEYLTEKLFELFSVQEVRFPSSSCSADHLWGLDHY